MQIENLSQLEIHKLTQEQYNRLASGEINGKSINKNALYMIPSNQENTTKIVANVTTKPNATVYYVDESGVSKSKVADANGKCTIYIPEYGEYTLYAELGGKQSKSIAITFDTAKLYEVSLKFSVTYGVKIQISNSDPANGVSYYSSEGDDTSV